MFDLDFDEKISLKYAEDVPENYDISEMRYTFDFIYQVLKRDAQIDSAIREVANEYGLSEDNLKDFLIENKYILSKMNKDDFSKQIKCYSTKSLKKILKKHGIKKSGKRDVIEKRIFENNLIGAGYYLSSKSKVFYKNKKRRMKIFNEFLEDYYYFDEFNEFYMNNFQKKEDKIPVEFVKLFVNKAVFDKNHLMYALNNQIMAEIYSEKENFKKMLEHVLKNFCINLNPVWKIDNLNQHYGIPLITYNHLIYLKGRLGKNRIISTYYVVWDSFNFDEIIVSKYIGYRYLKDIMNLKDLGKINRDLHVKFYSNDDLKIKRITQKTLFDF